MDSDLEIDSQPLFDDNLAPLATISDHEQSDSEDDNLSSLADHDAFSHLNVPEKMKDLLRMDLAYKDKLDSTQDDSESDDDSVIRGSISKLVDIEKLNAEIAKNKNKFMNFPLMPDDDDQQQEKEASAEKKSKKSVKKQPREKKKRRDKGKKKKDILEQAQESRTSDLSRVFENFAKEQSDSEEEEEEEEQELKKKNKNKKKKGRKTRKENTSNKHKVDENGERLIRTTEFLDTDTDESSEDEERALSKKQELEMYRESDRLRRAAAARLKPVYNIKSFDDFVKRRDEREEQLLKNLELSEQEKIQQKLQQLKEKEKQNKIEEMLKKQRKPNILDDDDEDDDLLVVNNPEKIAAALLSPERARNPTSIWSPVKQASSALRKHNQFMLNRITNEGYAHRIKMEQAAKARGQYASATERAKKLLEKEKNALMIDAQVKMHFEKKKELDDDDDDEEDEDYEEQGVEEDDYLNQLSGQEEEEEEEDEYAVEDFDTDLSMKRKMSNSDEDEDDEENDMGATAMKRWKSKKIRKSIFEDSDDDEEQEDKKKKKAAQKPVPKHSISNFFKAKEAEIAAQEEPIEEKPLSRLKNRRIIQNEEEHDEEDDNVEAMDIDEPVVHHKIHTLKFTGPQEKNEYFEEEAEEEEDEFYGAGGEDIDDGENLDEFEEDDLLVHDNNEEIDEAALREVFNKQDAESDSNMIQRLLKDITGGGLRKQKAAAEAGLMLDDIDLYDDEDNDLIAIRRAAAARRRKLLKKQGGDPLDNLLNDPKTAAFAKAAQPISEEVVTAFLSDSEVEEEEIEETMQSETTRVKLVIQEDDDDEEDQDDLMDVSSEEDNLLVDEFDPMASPLRGGLVSNSIITSADDDEDEEFQVETMQSAKSPLNNRKTKSMFGSTRSMERFKRLIAETNNNNNGTDIPRVGFGSLARTKSNNGEAEGEKPKTMGGSIGGFLASKKDGPRKSKLSALSKKSKNIFTYAEDSTTTTTK